MRLSYLLIGAAACVLVTAACGDEPASEPWTKLPTGGGGGAGGGAGSSSTGGSAGSGGSSSSSSAGSGGSSSSSSASSSSSSSGTGGSCTDTGLGEPANDQESGAVDLGTLAASDPDLLPAVQGVIAGSSDVDWYRYYGDDVWNGVVDPWRGRGQADLGLRICAYFSCDTGPTTVGGGTDVGSAQCLSGTADLSGEGFLGCCSDPGATSFAVDLGCGGGALGDWNAEVHLKVETQPGAPTNVCIPYTLSYHY